MKNLNIINLSMFILFALLFVIAKKYEMFYLGFAAVGAYIPFYLIRYKTIKTLNAGAKIFLFFSSVNIFNILCMPLQIIFAYIFGSLNPADINPSDFEFQIQVIVVRSIVTSVLLSLIAYYVYIFYQLKKIKTNNDYLK